MSVLRSCIRFLLEKNENQKTYYFAYGYNMSPKFLKKNCPSAEKVCTACLEDYSLVFNHSDNEDNAIWANAEEDPDHEVYGVLYKVNTDELHNLDDMEQGYRRVILPVRKSDNTKQNAWIYLSYMDEPSPGEKPKSWYVKLIKKAASENGFPEEYVRNITK